MWNIDRGLSWGVNDVVARDEFLMCGSTHICTDL